MGNIVICSVDKMFSIESLNLLFRRRNTDYVRLIIHDINCLLGEPHFDHRFIMSHLLNKMCQITGSEYGFVGSVMYDMSEPYLQTHAISNIAWNSVSHEFLLQNINGNLRFENLQTLFGEVILTDECVMINKYDPSRSVLPKGHPLIKRFLGVPYSFVPGKPVMMVGLCNKMTKFNRKDAKNIKRILNILSYLLVDITRQDAGNHDSDSNKSGSFSELKHELEEKGQECPVRITPNAKLNPAVVCNREQYMRRLNTDAYVQGITEEIDNDLDNALEGLPNDS